MVPYYLMNSFIYVSKKGVAFHSYINAPNKKRGGEKAGQWEIRSVKLIIFELEFIENRNNQQIIWYGYFHI